MKPSNARWLLSQLNRNPIFAVLIGGGGLLLLLGIMLNVFLVQPPEEQRRIWFLDLASPGWPAIVAGAIGWLTAFAVYHVWPRRYLLLGICILTQGFIVAGDEYARLWTVIAMLGIFAGAIDYVQSD